MLGRGNSSLFSGPGGNSSIWKMACRKSWNPSYFLGAVKYLDKRTLLRFDIPSFYHSINHIHQPAS
jgi:hypothetical protein